jgi:hypothetical protein
MGQYFKACNIDKKESVLPHTMGNMAKVMEHSYIGNNFVELAMFQLANSWKGDRFAWAGDYADENEEDDGNYYNAPEISIDDLLVDKIKDNNQTALSLTGFLYNETTMEMVDLKKYNQIAPPTDEDFWLLHPLPLLTCTEQGLGGGDYHGDLDDPRVGAWMGHALSVEADVLRSGYKDITDTLRFTTLSADEIAELEDKRTPDV